MKNYVPGTSEKAFSRYNVYLRSFPLCSDAAGPEMLTGLTGPRYLCAKYRERSARRRIPEYAAFSRVFNLTFVF